MRKLGSVLLLATALVFTTQFSYAGEWHQGSNGSLLCYQCHTMHFSQQHQYDPAATDEAGLGTGPNAFLLRAPANEMCLACHDGQTFAPDVMGANTNSAAYTNGRQAGGLNEVGVTEGEGYEDYMGHTLESTDTPPGGTWVNPGLECIHCHYQHARTVDGVTSPYRNLSGSRGGASSTGAGISYGIASTDTTTNDVWVNLASYTAGSGDATTFAPYYSFANIFFNEPDSATSKYGNWCSGCHTDFHGTANTGAGPEEFIRHPTAGVDVGALTGGHSRLTQVTGATTHVQFLSNEHESGTYTQATPSCMSCHKAHGNKNPFGLFFLNRNSVTVTEEGGWSATQTVQTTEQGLRNLCGQCHGQGNS